MKLLLAITSLVTLGLLIFASVEENYFGEWRRVQKEYKKILRDKAHDEAERKLAESYPVEPRQIVIPDLNTIDRCISCHVGVDDPRMAGLSQPFAFHPGDLPEIHDIEKFGCTACHGGQGRATTKREAHAHEEAVFWEKSLLMSPFNQSSCGVCHSPAHLRNKGAPLLARGLELLKDESCQSCHKLNNRGGTVGPALDNEGGKSKHEFPFAHVMGPKTVARWHAEHFKDPQKIVPGSKMPKLALNDDDVTALTIYVLSLQGMNLTEKMLPRDKIEERYFSWHPLPQTGKELYQQFCFGCHGQGTETIIHETLEKMMPAVRYPDFIASVSEDFLFKNIKEGRPGTYMPAWGESEGGLTDEEIHKIIAYLREGVAHKKTVHFDLAKVVNIDHGKNLFEDQCLKCHAITAGEGDASWLGSSVFQKTYDDALMGFTIKYGREWTLMEPYGIEAGWELNDQDISDVIAFIRTLK